MSSAPADLVERSIAGSEDALTELVQSVQGRVFNLSLRMLGQPDVAEDATQEILLRVVTHLSTFRRESSFTTWVYRIALNHLINTRAKTDLERARTFDGFGDLIDLGIASFERQAPAQVDHVLRNEVRLGCTHGMLVCLERNERAAFILGAILELGGEEAADLLGITPTAYRKRLSRARGRLEDFMRERCGLFAADNPCRCDKQVPFIQAAGKLDPKALAFAELGVEHPPGTQAGAEQREFIGLMDTVQVIDTQPNYLAKGDLVARLRDVLEHEVQP